MSFKNPDRLKKKKNKTFKKVNPKTKSTAQTNTAKKPGKRY